MSVLKNARYEDIDQFMAVKLGALRECGDFLGMWNRTERVLSPEQIIRIAAAMIAEGRQWWQR